MFFFFLPFVTFNTYYKSNNPHFLPLPKVNTTHQEASWTFLREFEILFSIYNVWQRVRMCSEKLIGM